MRVIVVGGGIYGLCVAWAMGREGHTVELFEQAAVPNPKGASCDEHRIIRHPYGDRDGYCRMVDEAFEAWELLWSDLGERLYVETGALALSDGTSGDWAEQSMASMTRCGVPFERLDTVEVGKRFPVFATGDLALGFHVRRGGALLAGRIVASLAGRLGEGVVHAGSRVESLDPSRAEIRLDGGKVIGADLLVVCAGAWVSRLIGGMERRVTPSRQLVIYLRPPGDLAQLWQRMPVVIELSAEKAGMGGFYGLPPVAGTRLKLGGHGFTLEGDPDEERTPAARGIDLADAAAELAGYAQRRIHGFDRYVIEAGRFCFYTVEADERFIVEPVNGAAWVLSGFSGHGFKFAAAIARRFAAVAGGVAGRVGGAEGARALTAWASGDGDRFHPIDTGG